MSRLKPYRQNPTPAFMNNYDRALSERFYLVQENGPTKLTIEDQNRRKFKIQIGSEIQCSCGGGRTEHCVHTIFSLIRIFKVDEADPLIWQLSFNDREIQQILDGRARNVSRGGPNPYTQRPQGGARAANAQRVLHQEARDILQEHDGRLMDIDDQINAILGRPNAFKEEQKWVEQRAIEPGENCCVCYDVMNEDENLVFCKFSCGRNLHTECMERWVKHKQSSGQDVSCPFCRTSWGRNALEDLKETTKQHRQRMREKLEEKRKERKQQPLPMTVDKIAQMKSERSFRCTCCKRQILYESKYQCLVCAKVQICKLCFKGGYHHHHQFIHRAAPDRDWEPAYQEGMKPPCSTLSESMMLYEQVRQELMQKKITTESYDMLLQLEKMQGPVSFERFCALAFQKEFSPPEDYFQNASPCYCCKCSEPIQVKDECMFLHNCQHQIHRKCLEELFKLDQTQQNLQNQGVNQCPQCQKNIFEGLAEAIKAPKMKQNKVLQKISNPKQNHFNKTQAKKVTQEMIERAQPVSFGISGTGLVANNELYQDTRDGGMSVNGMGRGRGQRPPLPQRRAPNAAAGGGGLLSTVAHGIALSGDPDQNFDFNLSGTQIGGASQMTRQKTIENTPKMSQISTKQNSSYLMRGGSGTGPLAKKPVASLSVQDGDARRKPDTNLFIGNNDNHYTQDLSSNPPASLGATNGRNSARNLGASLYHRNTNARPRDNSYAPESSSLFGISGNQLSGAPGAQMRQAHSFIDQEDQLQQQQDRFNELMRNKKAKDSIRKFDKKKRLEKAKIMQKNQEGPLNKYYRDQINGSQLGGPDLSLPSISATAITNGNNSANPSLNLVGQQSSSTGLRSHGTEPRRNGSMKRTGLGSHHPPKPPGNPKLNNIPGRMRGNEAEYRGFVGDLQADLSTFDVSGMAIGRR